jgi:acyl-CoA thioester hydrolase
MSASQPGREAAAPRRENFRHFVEVEVRWGDMDIMGHVNNSCYFTYLESGRIAYFNDLMSAQSLEAWRQTYGLTLGEIRCRFIHQLKYPAQIEVGTRISRLGRASIELEAAIFRKGEAEVVALSRGVIVWLDLGEGGGSAPVPDAVREAIRQYERITPAE